MKKSETWQRYVLKIKRAKGEQYETHKKKTIPAKTPKTGECPCPKKCHLRLDEERQLEIFRSFYALANYDSQNALLFSLVKVTNKCRNYSGREESRRQKTYIYHLLGNGGVEIHVCKKFFLRTLQVSDGRVTRVLKHKSIEHVPHIDQRGRQSSANKTPDNKITEVKEFIGRFPVYESHYTRHKSENRKFLSPDLSLGRIYSLYKDTTQEPVSSFIFSKIFNECFNLRFHAPISDSCNKCDLFNNKIKCVEDEQLKKELQREQELHQRKADSARQGLQDDTAMAKSSSDVTVITFDLMKTLPTPVLSTGIVYYKRQLWTFCFGIHNMGTDDAYMFVWNESEASRGPQEVGSCLIYFFLNFVTTKKVIMYSDQCGGQNRNIKLSLICQYVVSHPDFTIEEIDHKFLVSGHSYLPCDQDFGLIEKNKKFYKEIYVPNDWLEVIKTARKKQPFKIIRPTASDFFSSKSLEKNITNRKISVRNTKVEWLKIQWLKFHKLHPFSIFYKYSNNEEVHFEEVNVKKKKSEVIIQKLDALEKPTIAEKKKKDLLELLQFIPPVHHTFYSNLNCSNRVRDEVYYDETDEELF